MLRCTMCSCISSLHSTTNSRYVEPRKKRITGNSEISKLRCSEQQWEEIPGSYLTHCVISKSETGINVKQPNPGLLDFCSLDGPSKEGAWVPAYFSLQSNNAFILATGCLLVYSKHKSQQTSHPAGLLQRRKESFVAGLGNSRTGAPGAPCGRFMLHKSLLFSARGSTSAHPLRPVTTVQPPSRKVIEPAREESRGDIRSGYKELLLTPICSEYLNVSFSLLSHMPVFTLPSPTGTFILGSISYFLPLHLTLGATSVSCTHFHS